MARRKRCASTSEPAVGKGLGAGVLERDEREAAEAEFAAPAADDELLDPAAGAGWLDIEVQAVAIAVPPGLGDGVLAPFAVDQAADLCSCGHENDDSAAGLVCMSWTATGTRTTATWNA